MSIKAVYRAASPSPAPFGMVKIHSARDQDHLVADATATVPGIVPKLTADANKIADAARGALAASPDSGAGPSKLKTEVLDGIAVKPAAEFLRGVNAKNGRSKSFVAKSVNTRIPVVLVISDAWASKWFEFGRGSGASFPASRFMRVAGSAANSRFGKFKPRGRSR